MSVARSEVLTVSAVLGSGYVCGFSVVGVVGARPHPAPVDNWSATGTGPPVAPKWRPLDVTATGSGSL